MAAWAVGVEIPEPALGSTCTVRNQARAIVQMWLAGQASPKAANLATHLDPFADSSTGTSYVKDTIHEGPLAGRYAAQLLAQPRGQIGRLVRANWTQLVDFRTDYARAEQLLGLSRVAPTPAELSSCTWPSTIVQLMAPRGSGAAALSDALRAID